MVSLEIILLILALAVAGGLATDLGRGWLRRRQERRHLERLGDEGAEAAVARTPEGEVPQPLGTVTRRLLAAGLRVGVPSYLAASALLSVIVLLGVLEAFPGNFAAAVLAALLATWLPWSLLGTWARRRARRFEEKLVDAVAFMTSALQAGENPTRALTSAAAAAEGAVATELRGVVDRLDAGQEIWRALQPMVEGYDSEGTRLFAQTLIAKWATGGDLAPVLQRVNKIMRERLAMRLRLQSELAGARLGALIIALLPYLLIPVLLWRRPEWARALFVHPLGLQLFFSALLLQLVGILWLRRIMRFEMR